MMELRYDSSYNIAYIRLRHKTEEVEAIKVSDELVVDMAPDGKIYGIELLNANEQLGLGSKKSFTFINEKDAKRTEFTISGVLLTVLLKRASSAVENFKLCRKISRIST